ncbi:MAG: glutathione S-transferase family protein [Inquilinus sp.]|nr:glutathione S-transferase family protein [Inquilinus sp.]
MPRFTLVVGNKRYSSWSLRGWLALEATGAPFEEIVIPMDRPETRAAMLAHSAAGKVPVLKADGLTIWDSLAIGEYLAETYPEAGLWPADPAARAVARSAAAEMHSSFADLRRTMPMDVVDSRSGRDHTPEALADVARIVALWAECRARHGAGGPFLFGRYCLADIMYAPVVTRLVTYGVPLDDAARAYVDAVMGLPAIRKWIAAARQEPWVIDYP